VVEPDGDVIEEWEVFWELAHRMGTPIHLAGGELDLARKPTKFEVLQKITAGSRLPLDEVRRHQGGHIYDEVKVLVEPPDPQTAGRFQLVPEGIAEELQAVYNEPVSAGGGYGAGGAQFTHRLISRRLRHVYNSSGRDLPALQAKGTTNPAFMNPSDLARLGLKSGDLVEITSDHGAILGVAQATDELRCGVISMAHSWGDAPERDGQVREIGSPTNRLVNNAADYDPITGMARQSAIPVNVQPVSEAPRPH
jgi:anaerobic selenocysteine-containing dehydrogenase